LNRILILIKGLGRGGAEQLLVNAAPYLNTSRFRYEIAYLLPWKDALVGELESAGIPVTCLHGARGPGWVGRLRRLVDDHEIDLIHAHLPYSAIGARLAFWKNHRTRIVYTEHNMWQRYKSATAWSNALTFARNDFVFAVSDEVRGSIRYPRVMASRRLPTVETLYHGPDPEAILRAAGADGVREEFGIASDAPIIGTVANLKTHKGHEYLLQAALRVKQTIPGARFVWVGLGPLEDELKKKAAQLGLSDTVIFTGFREDAPRLMRAFDLFVLPSLHEGLPIALVEAMMLGKPVVVTRAGGTPEVVEDGGPGYLVPSRDPEALADRILRLLGDPDLSRRMGAAARTRAAAFDIRNSVARMERLYEELLAGAPSPT
jgi:glycosyltransferase involved in cell wall biosynthesis